MGSMSKKIQNIIADTLRIESDIEIGRCHRIGPQNKKQAKISTNHTKISTNHTLLFVDLTDLMINNVF